MALTAVEPQIYTYTITLPQTTIWEGRRAQQLMEQLLFAFGSLVFRIIATHDCMDWQIVDLLGREPTAIEQAIGSTYPESSVLTEAFGPHELAKQATYRMVIKYQHKVPIFLAPIQYAAEIVGPDPLASVTHAMSNLQPGERILYTLAVVGAAEGAFKEGQKLIDRPVYTGSLWNLAFPIKIDRYVPELQRVLLAKLQQRMYHTLLLIQLDMNHTARLSSLAVVDNQMVNFDRPNFNGVHWIADTSTNEVCEITTDGQDWETSALGLLTTLVSGERLAKPLEYLKNTMRLYLEPRELASLWHLPHEQFTAPTIAWSYPQVRLPAKMVGAREGICLGVNEYAGSVEPIYLPLPDRTGHMSIIGKAGVGKSNLMHQLIHQDIANNRPVVLLDPHGLLVRDVLRHSIPGHREHDVILLDLANEDYPPPMNLLSMPQGVDSGTAAGRVMAVLNTLYADFRETPTVADTLWASLVTLQHESIPTVRDVTRLLTDPNYRTTLVAQVDNPAAQEFWERYEQMSHPQQEQLARPVAWRLRSFYGNTALYPALCHPDTLDFSALLAQNKIILISLKTDEARIPAQEQRLLGLSLLSQLQLAVMTRPIGSQMVYMYVDEAQYFVTSPLESVLAEARKFGLSLTLANQYLKQLTGTMLDALMGNIGALVTFQCGLEDAKALAPYMTPGFDAEQLINLHKYTATIKLRFRDETQPAFSLKTMTPIVSHKTEAQALAREQHLRAMSRQYYTPKSRSEVMDWLKQRYPIAGALKSNTQSVVDIEPL